MRLTRETEYAILAAIYLGTREEAKITGRREIARQLHVPDSFLAKILRKLTRAGLVRSFQGTRGGYRLSLPPREVGLARLVEAIDGPLSLTRCLGRGERGCSLHAECLAREGLARLQGELRRILERMSLEDIMESAGDRLGHFLSVTAASGGLRDAGPGEDAARPRSR